MFTKALTTLVLTGALLVAGDASYQKFARSYSTADSGCFIGGSCCSSDSQAPSGGCCSQGLSRSSLLAAKSKSSCCSADAKECCTGGIVFCTRTGEIYESCCCELANGRYRCKHTGEIGDKCCCVPVE